jgi:hypothetical protein
MPFYADEGEIVQFSFHDPDEQGRGGSICLVVTVDASAIRAPRCGNL